MRETEERGKIKETRKTMKKRKRLRYQIFN